MDQLIKVRIFYNNILCMGMHTYTGGLDRKISFFILGNLAILFKL